MEFESKPPLSSEAQTGADEARWREGPALGSDPGWHTKVKDAFDAPAPSEPSVQRPSVAPEPLPLVSVEAQNRTDTPLSDSVAPKTRASSGSVLRGSQRQRGKPPAAAAPEVRGVETNSHFTPSREACSTTIVALGLCSTNSPAKDKP
jgi:hypothetical protein